MRVKKWGWGVAWVVVFGVLASDASAWGPRAKHAIAATALDMVRRTHPQACKAEGTDYDVDVLRGMLAGRQALGSSVPLNNDNQVVMAVGSQIEVLREARKYGSGSYLAFRMGVLAALVADIVLPHSLGLSPEETMLRERIGADIDAHLAQYRFTPASKTLTFVRDPEDYFGKKRTFFEDDKKMIADDYRRGKGYGGFLSEGGEAYFGRAVECVADVWHTILGVEADQGGLAPSRRAMTWYLVGEIGYLLNQKQNLAQAEKTYLIFQHVNPGIIEPYLTLGDLYYAFGAKERGVQEWEIAYRRSGPHRRQAGAKLATHYITEGQGHLLSASGPDAQDSDLTDASNAFELALDYDRTNDYAADLLRETKTRIKERNERILLMISFISAGEKVLAEAHNYKVDKVFGPSIDAYNQAIALFELVDDEFKDLKSTADSKITECRKGIAESIREVLADAQKALDEGDHLIDLKQFDQAIEYYRTVETIVKPIPGDESSERGKDRLEMIDTAKRRVEQAELERRRWQEQQAEKAAQAAKAAAAK